MESYNPNISNGTCYYAENTETKGRFVPCGNNALQVWPCCQLGSYCLSLGDANACWDPNSGNTYVAGCTDPSFTDPNCLHKPPRFHEQEWVAINQACKNLNTNSANDGTTNWTGCVVDNNSTELVKLPLASCTPYCSASDVLYAGSSSLGAYASLPTLAGSSIFWQNNYAPPTTPAPGYTPGVPVGVVGTHKPTSSSSSSNDDDGGLSTGAKAGIGVGAAVGGILLLAGLAGFLVTWSRRRKRQQRQQQQQQGFEPSSNNLPPSTTPGYSNHGGYNQYSQDMSMYGPPSSGGYPSPPLPYSNTYYHHELGSSEGYSDPQGPAQGAAYMGYKSELPADEPSGTGYKSNLGEPSHPEQSKTPLSAASTVLPTSPQSGMPRHNSTGGDLSPRYTDR
ncbi:hypothetical protein QBC42DRAFT_274346 [Cladorrhinum samala]|uniref:Uncharacterized protein n=1 Tax=Cladorrhinum samala TaxID=585594 RepID=A0AAV9HHD6_9PEZI|nr:hypothetical protein QBC42DRAFT_274346 [Cladorrhinum samala]